MNIILNIETSADLCSVSIAKNTENIAIKEVLGFSHSEKLAVLIDELLKENALEPKDLSAIAISQGPGSYTGLRIGISLAKGMCYALKIPLIAVNTLKLIALDAKNEIQDAEPEIISLIDARRDEVYLQHFDKHLIPKNKPNNLIVESASFSNLTNTPIYFTGSGAEKTQKIIEAKPNHHFLSHAKPHAKNMPSLSFEKFTNQDFEDTAYFEPFYLKPFFSTQKKS